jgi:integrase
MTLAEYAAQWMTVVRRTRKPSTAQGYAQILRDFVLPVLGTRELADLRRADILAGLASYPPPTVRRVLPVLQALFSTAVADDALVRENPTAGVRRRLRHAFMRDVGDVPALTADELRRFLEVAWEQKPALAPVYETMARAGLRLGEALALQHADRTADGLRVMRTYSQKRLTSPKSGLGRLVEIGPTLEAILAALPRDGPWIFPGPRAPLWDATWVGQVCSALGDRVGLAVHPHALRHTYASLLLAAGEPPEWVSRQLGHASLTITIQVYGRWIRSHNPEGLAHYDTLLAPTGGVRRRGPRRRLVPGARVHAA